MFVMFNKILFLGLIFLHSISFLNCQVNENSLLDKYNFNDNSNLNFTLDKSLNEISGLTPAGGNFVYAHNDEKGIIFKVDITNGKIVSQFSLGDEQLEKDFEDIACVNDSIYIITSEGVLYEFLEGENNHSVKYDKIETGLKKGYDIEGLCYDPETHSLLLACKDVIKKKHKQIRFIYEFDLNKNKILNEPRYFISLDQLKDEYDISNFAPSGIERHPLNGNLFIVSANEPAVIETSSDGVLLNAAKLKDKKHRQTEGITILDDNKLILSDEAKGKRAKLTIINFE